MPDLWVLWQDVRSEVYMTVPVQQAVPTNTGIRFAHAKRCSAPAECNSRPTTVVLEIDGNG